MIDLQWWSCILIFGVAAALTVVCTPVAIRLAKRYDCFDTPAAGKSQRASVPYLGGLAMVVPFAVMAGIAGLVGTSARHDVSYLAVFLAMAVGLAAVGLVDDLRGLSPWPRLVLEIGAGIGVWRITTAAWIPGPRLLQALLTVVWVVIVTNSFNLLDNMDGLAAGVAAVSSIFLFAVALENGQFLLATFALVLAGCGVGFLRYNFCPARIYMGDAGSLFFGFILAVLSLDLRFPTAQPATFVVPVLIVGVALFDTTLVSITRVLQGRTPFQGGLDHVSHRLVFVGLSVRATVCLLYSVAVALGSIALVITGVDWSTRLIVGGLLTFFAVASGFVLAKVPVYREAGAGRTPTRADRTRVQADHAEQFALGGNGNGHRPPLDESPAYNESRRGA